MVIVQNIVIHSTDSLLEYPDPASFIESLPNYIKIHSELPDGLGMISIGQDAPDQQYQDIPWFQLDENNNPIALKFFNGIEWTETKAFRSIEGPYEGLQVQYGTISMTHIQATHDTWVDSVINNNGAFKFPEQFKPGTSVQVQITPVFSSVFRDQGTPSLPGNTTTNLIDYFKNDKDFDWALGDATTEGFNLMTKTKDISIGLSFKFNWVAFGEKV